MQRITKFYKNLREFTIDSDYFCLVDAVHLLFERGPPSSTRQSVRIAWMSINILTTLQVLCLMIQFVRFSTSVSEDLDEFMNVFNQSFILTTTLARCLCLTYHHRSVLELKKYINSKLCQRFDSEAFELRRDTFRRNIKYMAIFQCTATLNCIGWIPTDFWYHESLQIPYLLDYMPSTVALATKVFYAIIYHSWSVLVYASLTQFGTILNSLRTELKIIVGEFRNIFAKVAANHVLELGDLDSLNQRQSDEFWIDLDRSFKEALEFHSAFVRNYEKLKKIANENFLILLASTTIIITTNTLIFMSDLSLSRLPLQMVGVQFMLETYMCCSLITTIETENKRIAEYVYGIDWLAVKRRSGQRQREIGSAIRQNVIILQRQVHKGLSIRAGSMLAVDLETFSKMMKLVYSLLTFIRRQQGLQED